MKAPTGMLIDLDDTIVNDSGCVDSCWNDACAQAVPFLDGISPARLRAEIERERDWFWSDAARHRQGRLDLRAASAEIVCRALASLGSTDRTLARRIADRYRDLREERACLFPGAVETLERLRAANVRLALITNGSGAGQRAKIERFGLARYFDHILIVGEFGAGKPDPTVYETSLAALGATPDAAWSVGDNLEWDVAAPQRLGMRSIWIDRNQRDIPAGSNVRPDAILSALSELEL